jgi:TolB protein
LACVNFFEGEKTCSNFMLSVQKERMMIPDFSVYKSPLPRWRWWFITALMTLLISGCSAMDNVAGGFVARMPLLPMDGGQPSATGAALSLDELRSNRLLGIDRRGNLFTIDADGGNRFAITNDATANRIYSQPTWSPDGSYIAFAQVDNMQSSQLIVVRADGNQQRALDVPFAPFFLFWNPQGSELAYLSNWIEGRQSAIALNVVDVEREQLVFTTVSTGQPLYFSWSPAGDQILTHVGNREVALTALDGSRVVLANPSSNFATPQWLGDGDHLLYGVDEAGNQQIVLTNLAGEIEQRIAFNGAASFFINSTGDTLAFVDTMQAVGTNAFGPLFLLDLEDEIYRQLSQRPVVFFTWSPDGQALLYITLEPYRGQTWLQLYVWREEDTFDLGRFRPSSLFFDQYLRFGDQYAQSHRYWSPDSESVVFSGVGEDGRSGIWVQNANGVGDPSLVAPGLYATWSPWGMNE